MAPIRVLIVDDSALVRKILTEALSAHPDIEVVGIAQNGKVALSKIEQLQPDAVTLDIEMPVMDGLELLPSLREKHPYLPVVVFSSQTAEGAAATLEALTRGASAYALKPSDVTSLTESVQEIQDTLGAQIVSLCRRCRRPASTLPTPASSQDQPARSRPEATRVDIVAIGVSTGGPNALAELFPRLPANLPVPIVVVQHMPAEFTRLLAERLDGTSALTVRECIDGSALRAGDAWIAPGGRHMVLVRSGASIVLSTNQDPPENSCRPSVDPLFRSVERLYGGNVLAVVLTGMGQDGLAGTELLHRRGAQVIAQDEASSVVWGMPAAVVRGGLGDVVLPLQHIADEITRRCWEFRTAEPDSRSDVAEAARP